MGNINSCVFSGNLTRDPKVGISANGNAYASFSLGVNNRCFDTVTGTYEDVPQFIDFIAFDDAAKAVRNKKRGNKLVVRCRLEQGMYRDKDGKIRRRNVFKVLDVDDYRGGEPRERPWSAPQWY